jgi:hypothetical protein
MLKFQDFCEGCHNAYGHSRKCKRVDDDKNKAKGDVKAKKRGQHDNPTINEGNMTTRTTTSIGYMINVVQMIIEEMIMNPGAMNARVMTATVTRTSIARMIEDIPRTWTNTRTKRKAFAMQIS